MAGFNNSLLKGVSNCTLTAFNKIERQTVDRKYQCDDGYYNQNSETEVETMDFDEYQTQYNASYGTAGMHSVSNAWKDPAIYDANLNLGDDSIIINNIKNNKEGYWNQVRKYIDEKLNPTGDYHFENFWSNLSDEDYRRYFYEFLDINPGNKYQTIQKMLQNHPELRDYDLTDEELWEMCWNFKLEEKALGYIQSKQELAEAAAKKKLKYGTEEYEQYISQYESQADSQIHMYNGMLDNSEEIIKIIDPNYDGSSFTNFQEILNGDFDAKAELLAFYNQGYDIESIFGVRIDLLKQDHYSDNYLRSKVRDEMNEIVNSVNSLKTAISSLEELKKAYKYTLIQDSEEFENFEAKKPTKEELSHPEKMNEKGYNPIAWKQALEDNGMDNTEPDWGHFGHNMMPELRKMEQMANDDEYPQYKNIVKMYEFLYEKGGESEANKYIQSLEKEMNYYGGKTAAEEAFNKLDKDERGRVILNTENAIKVGIEGECDGVSSWLQGLTGWTSHDTLSALDYKQMYLLKMLEDNEALTVDYELNQSIGNVVPSMALSVINPALGSASIFFSAGGNAYREAVVKYGSNDLQGFQYAILSGTSEMLLERVIGGIPGLSNIKVTNFKSLLKAMVGEGFEEGTQTYISQGARLALGIENSEDVDWENVRDESAKSILYGAATAGILQGGGLTAGNLYKGTYNSIINNPTQIQSLDNIPSFLESLAEKAYLKNQEGIVETFKRISQNTESNLIDIEKDQIIAKNLLETLSRDEYQQLSEETKSQIKEYIQNNKFLSTSASNNSEEVNQVDFLEKISKLDSSLLTDEQVQQLFEKNPTIAKNLNENQLILLYEANPKNLETFTDQQKEYIEQYKIQKQTQQSIIDSKVKHMVNDNLVQNSSNANIGNTTINTSNIDSNIANSEKITSTDIDMNCLEKAFESIFQNITYFDVSGLDVINNFPSEVYDLIFIPSNNLDIDTMCDIYKLGVATNIMNQETNVENGGLRQIDKYVETGDLRYITSANNLRDEFSKIKKDTIEKYTDYMWKEKITEILDSISYKFPLDQSYSHKKIADLIINYQDVFADFYDKNQIFIMHSAIDTITKNIDNSEDNPLGFKFERTREQINNHKYFNEPFPKEYYDKYNNNEEYRTYFEKIINYDTNQIEEWLSQNQIDENTLKMLKTGYEMHQDFLYDGYYKPGVYQNAELLSAKYLSLYNTPRRNALFTDTKVGADQNICSDCKRWSQEYFNEVCNVIRDILPGLTTKEIQLYLECINTPGACSYSKALNMIYQAFYNNEKTFKYLFGYDMYKYENGQKVLNDGIFLADLYTFVNKDNKAFFYKDVILNRYIYKCPQTHDKQIYISGSSGIQVEYVKRFIEYKLNKVKLKTSVNVKDIQVYSLAEFNQDRTKWDEQAAIFLLKDNIMMAFEKNLTVGLGVYVQGTTNKHFTMYELNSETGKYDIPFSSTNWFSNSQDFESGLSQKDISGHGMTITGIDDNGMFLSSWSREYYFPFTQLKNLYDFRIDALEFDSPIFSPNGPKWSPPETNSQLPPPLPSIEISHKDIMNMELPELK